MEENTQQNNLQPPLAVKSNTNLPIILLAVFVIFFLAIGIPLLILSTQYQQNKRKQQDFILSKEIQDEVLGFSIHYPDDWNVLPLASLSTSSERTITNCNLKQTNDQNIKSINNCASFNYRVGFHYNQQTDNNFTFSEWVNSVESENTTNPIKIGRYPALETDYRKIVNEKAKHKNIYIDLGNKYIAEVYMEYAENYQPGYETLNKMLSSLMVVSPSIPPKKNNASIETGDWKTFTNDLLGFTMRYPWSWYLDRENNSIYSFPKTNNNPTRSVDEQLDKGKGVVSINLVTNKQADLTLEDFIDSEVNSYAKRLGLDLENKIVLPKIKFEIDGKLAIKTDDPSLKGPFPQVIVYIEKSPTETYAITAGMDYLSYESNFNLMLSTFTTIYQIPTAQISDTPKDSVWREYNGYLYKRTYVDKKTWEEAEEVCTEENSKLASINNMEEDLFVQQLCGTGNICRLGHKNIGGYCVKPYGNWVDGKPFIYSNWQEGEPDYVCSEDCLDMDKNGKWNNEWCNNPYGYDKYAICKKKK